MIRTFLGRCLASLIVCQFLMGGIALAGPQEDVAAASMKWAAALAENDPDKVLPFYAQDAVLWGTLSPTVRSSPAALRRSEEHTSELQSRLHLVCRLLLE